MPSNFPTGPDTIINNVANTTPELDTHPNVHNQLADAVMAVENSLLPGGPMNLAAHVAASDPHPVYLTQPEGDARYAPIGGGGGGGAPSGPAGGALSGTYPNPTLAPNSVATGNIVDGTIAAGDMAAGAAATNVGTLGGALTGSLPNPGLAPGSVTTTEIADGTIQSADLAAGTAATNVGVLGGVLGGNLPNPTMAAGAAATNVGTLGGALTGSLPNPGLATGSVTTTAIADGTITTADLANQAVTNAKLGTDTARLNLLTNGGMEVWQRGVGPFTAQSAWAADRWQLSIGGGSTLSVSRDTTNVDVGSGAAAALTYTHAAETNFMQKMEDLASLKGRTVTLSMRVRTSTPNAVRLFSNSAGGGGLAYSAYHSGGGAYETLSVTQTISAATTTLWVGVSLMASCTAYVDNAMLVVGSVAADYAPLHPADDLARCLRYYEASSNGGSEMVFSANGTTGNAVQSPMQWRVMKAVTPTVTKVGTWNVVNCGQPATGLPNIYGYQLYAVATATGLVSFYNGTAGSFITSEANA